MLIYELNVTVKLKKAVKFSQIPGFLSKNINYSFLLDKDLKNLHYKNHIKPYSLSFLQSHEGRKDLFDVNEIAFFKIRSVFPEIIESMKYCLENSKGFDFQVLGTLTTDFAPTNIQSLYTMSPAVVTISIDNKSYCWTKKDSDILTLKNSLETNLKNKFSLFVNDSVSFNDDIIELIEIKNDKPFMFPYKSGKIFAYRYKVYFANNSHARELAKIALALGLGEKGSLAFGFCEKGR